MAEDQVGLQEVHKDHKDATVASGCMIPKSAAQVPSSEECALFSASQSEPTQHEHMAETTTTEPGGITPAPRWRHCGASTACAQ